MTAIEVDLPAEIAAATARRNVTTYRPLLLDAEAPDAPERLLALASDPSVEVVDEVVAQLEQLVRGRTPGEELSCARVREGVESVLEGREPARYGTWAFYPWSRRLVHLLPPPLHHELRLDRNRYEITMAEQERLGGLVVAVAGLSVGRAVVSTMVHEGISGELRLADFDVLELSNLNRVAGGVADVGVSKVVLAAREVAELDPYVRVVAFERGVQDETIAEFVAGADVIVDECDGLEMKVALREQARAAGRPVVMATSHRGMLDVERFDLEPGRAPFHGLLGGVGSSELRGLTTKQKIPYVLRIVDAAGLSDRMAASLVEVRESVTTWPQLASDVALGGAMVANAVRRIALGELTASGRFYADLDELVADRSPATPTGPPPPAAAPARVPATPPAPGPATSIGSSSVTPEEVRHVVACAASAPSGGNMQPWRFEAEGEVIRGWVDPERSSLLDFQGRASLLALGGALEAACIGARTLGRDAVARVLPGDGPVWELALGGSGPRDERAADILWQRCCNRRTGASPPVPDGELRALARSGAPLDVAAVPRDGLRELGEALGALDRVRFLSERLRRELIGELRFDGAEAVATRDGIDVASLELDAADRAAMDVLRTGAGMDLLARLGRGHGLGNASRDAFAGAGGAVVLRARGVDRVALVEAGRGLMRLWLEATRRGLAVHPWGSPFLFQRLYEDPESLDDFERTALARAAHAFAGVVTLDPDRPILLILRLARETVPPTARSLRRTVEDVLGRAQP
jgi:molybdopterin/thiamine biosynthesis adenylyltransferase